MSIPTYTRFDSLLFGLFDSRGGHDIFPSAESTMSAPIPLLGDERAPLEQAPAPSRPANKKAQLPATWHLASGAVSGAASVLALQPLDCER